MSADLVRRNVSSRSPASESGTGVAQISRLEVSLGSTKILHGIDLHIAAGEIISLLGPNGSGKSTLVRAAIGLIPIDSGSISLFGTPLRRFKDWRSIGYVPQRTTASSGVPATVEEIVTSGRLRNPLSRVRKSDRSAVDDALEAVSLTSLRRRGVGQLSGGQQQRVLVARALARQPKLLVMDEPMAGVDLEQQESFAHTVSILRTRGTTVLLVLHEIGALAPLITRAIALQRGVVEYDGPPLAAPDHCLPGEPGYLGEQHDHRHEHVHHHVQQHESSLLDPHPMAVRD